MVSLLLIAPTCNGEDVGEAWVGFQWAKHLGARHDVTLLTYHKRDAKPATEQLSGMRIVEWKEMPFVGRAERLNSMLKPSYLPFYIRARRWIGERLAVGERFDIVHQAVPVAMRYPSPAAGFDIPLVIGPVGGGLSSPSGFDADAGSSPWFTRLRRFDRFRMRWDPQLRRSFGRADYVLGIADYVRESLADIPLKRFEVMSETGLNSVPDPIERAGRTGAVRLLYVGRLVRTKGVRDLVRAMALVTDLPLHLDIVGEGSERAICEELVATLGLSDRITLHGWKSKPEVERFYRDADCFVFPSYCEPGGNVALEAMGYSLPLVVVDRGGPGSATSPACALRLHASTPEALARDIADAIRTLATDRNRRWKMGRLARLHVAATALWSAKMDRMDQIYAELLRASRKHDAIPSPGARYLTDDMAS